MDQRRRPCGLSPLARTKRRNDADELRAEVPPVNSIDTSCVIVKSRSPGPIPFLASFVSQVEAAESFLRCGGPLPEIFAREGANTPVLTREREPNCSH